MKSLGKMRAAIISLLLLALLASFSPPRSIVEAQSGREPPKKKVEKKTEEQKGGDKTKQADENNQDPIPPIPKNQKDEPPIKISTRLPRLVATGIIELRKAWPKTARRKLTPFATAVRT